MLLRIGGMGFMGLNTALRPLEVEERVVITRRTAHRIQWVHLQAPSKRGVSMRKKPASTFTRPRRCLIN